jgi:hypothetical protein
MTLAEIDSLIARWHSRDETDDEIKEALDELRERIRNDSLVARLRESP